jgi:hypothetical protein
VSKLIVTAHLLTLSFATTYFRKVEALFSADDAFKEAFLLFSRYYLVLSINESLITRKVIAKPIDEFSKRKLFVQVDVKELLLEDAIVTTVL